MWKAWQLYVSLFIYCCFVILIYYIISCISNLLSIMVLKAECTKFLGNGFHPDIGHISASLRISDQALPTFIATEEI